MTSIQLDPSCKTILLMRTMQPLGPPECVALKISMQL